MVQFYYHIWGTNIRITHKDYDESDVEITDGSARAKRVYTIEVLRMINGPSFTMASIVPGKDTKSSISISAPILQSSVPLSGAFYIECPNADGNPFRTRDMGRGWEA